MFPLRDPPIILSIGGALIVPEQINAEFLKHLNFFIREQVKKGRRFFLVAGGGKTARYYRDAGKHVIGSMTDEDLDWLGIHATRLNAHLLRTIFQDIAHPRIIENYDKRLVNWKEPVVIGAGWKPGWSTDYDAVILARDYGANLIVNLSNIDWVYTDDPKKNPDAKPIEKMTWEEFERLVGTKWVPGLNAPFDPVAAQLAKSHRLTAIITNGNDFSNLERIIEGDSFKGTIIMPYRIDASFYDRAYYSGNKKESRLGNVDTIFGRIFKTLATWYRAWTIKLFLHPKNCLDVGCGTGGLVSTLRSIGIDAYGVEISADALEMADEAVKPYLKQADVGSLPYEDNSFDLVCSFDVLEHVERGKLAQAINETIRVSRRYILHKIFTQENWWMRLLHRRDFSRISVFKQSYWRRIFGENNQAILISHTLIRWPSVIETLFLLKKK